MAREGAVVHAHHADHLGGEDLASRQLAEGRAVGKAGAGAGCSFAEAGDCRAHRFEGDGRRAVGDPALFLELVDQRGHGVHFGEAGQVRVEAADDFAQRRRPVFRRALLVAPCGEREKLFDVAQQSAEPFVVAGAGLEAAALQGASDHALDHRRILRDRVAEQQPSRAVAPGVAGGDRHVEAAEVRGVDAPADAGVVQGVAQHRQVVLVDAETQLHRTRPQRRQNRRSGVARTRQGEDVQQRLHRRVVASSAAADVDRNGADRGEHGLDRARVVVQRRREDQHVRRFDVRVGIEYAEQPVVQHFRFAHGGVADVDLQRVVARDGFLLRTVRGIAQLEDVALHGGESGGRIGVAVALAGPAHPQVVGEQRLHVARWPPPEREQPVAFVEVGLARRGTLAGRARVGPELSAWTQKIEMNIHPRCRATQHLQIGGRQDDDAEEAHPRPRGRRRDGQHQLLLTLFIRSCRGRFNASGHRRATRAHRLAVGVDGVHPVRWRHHFRRQLLPKLGLPMRRFAALPGAYPVRSIQQAAVVDLRQALGQFVAAAFARRGGRRRRIGGGAGFRLQIAGQGVVALPVPQPFVDAPTQARRREGLGLGERRHRFAHRRPRELGWKLDAQVRGDAEFARKREAQPASERRVRHDDAFRRQRVARFDAHPFGQLRGEDFQLVRGVQPQAGRQRLRGGRHAACRYAVVSVAARGVQRGASPPGVANSAPMPRPGTATKRPAASYRSGQSPRCHGAIPCS